MSFNVPQRAKAIASRDWIVDKVIAKWREGDTLQNFGVKFVKRKIGGSYAKGTATRKSFDFDILLQVERLPAHMELPPANVVLNSPERYEVRKVEREG